MIVLAYILSGLSLLMSVLLLVQSPKPPLGFLVLVFKLTASALSPYWAIMGAVGAAIGVVYEAYWAIPVGIVGTGMMIWYVWRCSRANNGFDNAFGAGWSEQILPQQAKRMVQKRWAWFLKMKASPKPFWERDIAFWTILNTERELLWATWQ